MVTTKKGVNNVVAFQLLSYDIVPLLGILGFLPRTGGLGPSLNLKFVLDKNSCYCS